MTRSWLYYSVLALAALALGLTVFLPAGRPWWQIAWTWLVYLSAGVLAGSLLRWAYPRLAGSTAAVSFGTIGALVVMSAGLAADRRLITWPLTAAVGFGLALFIPGGTRSRL